jgi:hypothetical protein
MLVNKRTPVNDSSVLRIDFSTGPGMTEIALIDSVPIHLDTAYDSLGVTTKYQAVIQPGAAKLFRIRHQETFKGAWSGTWPQFSTIKVVGDITINSGNLLTVQTSGVKISSNTDSLSSGRDIHKIEFIVQNGTLVLQGSANNRIVLAPTDTATDTSWYGIRSTGRVYADNVIVRKAYSGFTLKGVADTIRNSSIRDCYMYGVYDTAKTVNSSLFMDHDTLLANNPDEMIYGISLRGFPSIHGAATVNASIRNCRIWNAQYPIVQTSASSVFSSCNIARGNTQPFNSGTKAINSAGWDRLTLENSQIRDYRIGLNCGYLSVDTVFNCHFVATQTYPPSTPVVDRAIVAEDYSICFVRLCCFDPAYYCDVYRHAAASVDLGNYIFPGYNNFIGLPWSGGSPYPFCAVSNDGYDPIPARENYWDPILVSAGNWCNPGTRLDTVGAYFTTTVSCASTAPPANKLSEGASNVDSLAFRVDQNYPNPFNPSTQIAFTLPATTHVLVEVFNILGQLIRTVADAEFAAGEHNVLWDGTNSQNLPVSSGVYLYRVTAGPNIVNRKMIMIK